MSAAGRLNFVVLGQNCRPLGSFTRTARKGVNRVRFYGRLHGKALKPGTYTLVPYFVRARQRQMLARITVQIVPPNRRLTAAERRRPLRTQCAAALLGVAGGSSQTPAGSSGSSAASGSSGLVSSNPGATNGEAGVAGVTRTQERASTKSDPITDLPVLSAIIPEDSPVPPLLLAVLALVGIGLGSLVLIAFLLRYFRGSWVP